MKRNTDLDFIRALLIILMILIHIVSFGNAYPHLKAGILSFMMPTFLIITGYLVNIEKSIREYGKYLLCLALPYVIMVTGFSILSYFLPVRDGITELSLVEIANKIFVTSIGPYWFIQTMIICGILYYACITGCEHLATKYQKGKPFTLTARLFLLALSFVLVAKTPALNITAAAYYFVGVVIRQSHIDFSKIFCPTPLALPLWAFILYQEDLYGWGNLAVMFSCWCCLSTFLWISQLIGKTTNKKSLAYQAKDTLLYIGRNTLPIYLFHPIFTMLAKFYHPLLAFDTTEVLMAVITIILAITGCIAIAKMMEKTKLAYIFGKGKMLR